MEDAEAPPVQRAKNDLFVLGLGDEEGPPSDEVRPSAGAEAAEWMLMLEGLREGRGVELGVLYASSPLGNTVL